MKPALPFPALTLSLAAALLSGTTLQAAEIFIRANQIHYRPNEPKLAIAFSTDPLPDTFKLVSQNPESTLALSGKTRPIESPAWGNFSHHAELDFSKIDSPGEYILQIGDSASQPVFIGKSVYGELAETSLEFMRQQRCGFNSWINENCHQHDGRTAYGPLPYGSPIDASGGWHDAGDMLKYLLTSSNATAQMLLAYELTAKPGDSEKETVSRQSRFADAFDARGLPGANGIPDLLDEARWGLEWMLKLHPEPDHLYHQVADDRDHAGWRLPHEEFVDYGWGPGGPRTVYFADGEPQGLKESKSQANGLANLAGRYAAAMALAHQIWKDDPLHRDFAERCLQAGREVYDLSRAKEGFQQGNSYGEPYRYEETTWADDMEWGAAELFRATGESRYLTEAKRYAETAAAEGWMGRQQTRHYQFYPFLNIGHFRLHDLVDSAFQEKLAGFYRDGLDRCVEAAQTNPYGIGVPFIWCSNNLIAAIVTQSLLYERMTGDTRYRDFTIRQRDWLFGRNPWDTTMFTGIGRDSPEDVHLWTVQLLQRPVRGGLVDGPVYQEIFASLKGINIRQPDPLAPFQGPAVYHDDVSDYSTNEPTMDGTASAILMFALLESQKM